MSAPFTIRPFDFGTVFAVAAPVAKDTDDGHELKLRLAALEAELAIARQGAAFEIEAARNAGYEAGRAAAEADQGAALLAATDALHASVETVETALGDIAAQAAREAADVAHAAAELLAGRALEWAPAAAIDDAIGRVLSQVARGQEIQVRVHPGMVEAVDAVIARRQAADRRKLALTTVADEVIAPGDAHIHWDRGGVVLDAAARAEAVRDALAGALPAPA